MAAAPRAFLYTRDSSGFPTCQRGLLSETGTVITHIFTDRKLKPRRLYNKWYSWVCALDYCNILSLITAESIRTGGWVRIFTEGRYGGVSHELGDV